MILLQPLNETVPTHTLDEQNFTEREREIAERLMRGASSDEICDALGIAPETLKSHVKNMLAKTGTRNRTELVAKLLGSA